MASWGGGEESELDRRNQQKTFDLASKVSQLRSIAVDLEQDAYEHNRLLDGVSDDFTAGESFLGGSLNRARSILTGGQRNRKMMCYTIFGVVAILVLFYFMLTRGAAH